jgi:hypothetical protein
MSNHFVAIGRNHFFNEHSKPGVMGHSEHEAFAGRGHNGFALCLPTAIKFLKRLGLAFFNGRPFTQTHPKHLGNFLIRKFRDVI